jgi:antitoxin ParD1/3/4
MATLNISLPDAMREWIDAQIDAGEYANASDYIRDLIRHDQRERESIRSDRSVMDIARQSKRKLRRA